jgi:hypothetical protein
LPGVSAAPPPIKLGAGETPYVPAPPQLTYPGGAGMAGQPGQPGQPAYPRTQPGPIQASPLGALARAPIAQPSPLPPPTGAAPPGGQPTVGGTLPLGPPMTIEEKAAAEARGKATGEAAAGLENTKTTLDYLHNKIQSVLNHKGLNDAVGPGVGLAPWLPGEGGNFIAELGGLQGQALARAINNIRTVRGIDSDKLTASIADLNRRQSPEQFKIQLRNLDQLIAVQRKNAITAAGANPEEHAASTLPQPEPPAGFKLHDDGRYISEKPNAKGKYEEWKP